MVANRPDLAPYDAQDMSDDPTPDSDPVSTPDSEKEPGAPAQDGSEPSSSEPKQQQPPERRLGLIAVAVIAVVAALVVAVVILLPTDAGQEPAANTPQSAVLPGTFQDYPVLTNEIGEQFQAAAAQTGGTGAMYGSEGRAAFGIIAIPVPSDAPEGDLADGAKEALSGAANGMDAEGVSLDLDNATTAEDEDAAFACATATGGPFAYVCVWMTPERLGMIYMYPAAEDPLGITRAAHEAIELRAAS